MERETKLCPLPLIRFFLSLTALDVLTKKYLSEATYDFLLLLLLLIFVVIAVVVAAAAAIGPY
jgi:hypothetical protein